MKSSRYLSWGNMDRPPPYENRLFNEQRSSNGLCKNSLPTDHVFEKQREIKCWENELTPLLLFSITVFLSYSVMS